MPNLNIVVNSIPERPGEARGRRTEGDLQDRALSGADLAGPFEGHRWESKPPSRPPRNDAIGLNRNGGWFVVDTLKYNIYIYMTV
jgi:hypothetical protein